MSCGLWDGLRWNCGIQTLPDAWSRDQRLMLLKSIVGYADAFSRSHG